MRPKFHFWTPSTKKIGKNRQKWLKMPLSELLNVCITMPNNIISMQKAEFCDLNPIWGDKNCISSCFEAKLGPKCPKITHKLVRIAQKPPI